MHRHLMRFLALCAVLSKNGDRLMTDQLARPNHGRSRTPTQLPGSAAAIHNQPCSEVEATPEVQELLRRYGSGAAAAGHGPSRLDGIHARIGWQLIRWGMRLRRRAEARSRGRYADRDKGRASSATLTAR